MPRVAKWRDLGRPEAALIGVQYRRQRPRRARQARGSCAARPESQWLFAGVGCARRREFSDGGIEIDATAPSSPPGTQVVAEIPDLLGPGLTAQMTYYETRAAPRSSPRAPSRLARHVPEPPVQHLLANLWRTARAPSARLLTSPSPLTVYDSRPMRRLALVVLALACSPTAAAAGISRSPSATSRRRRSGFGSRPPCPKPERVGVQLATEQGKALGWIVEPSRRRFLTLRWNGRLNGARVRDGSYLVRLIERGQARRLLPAPDRPDGAADHRDPGAQPQPGAVPGRQRPADDDLVERRRPARVGEDHLQAHRTSARALRGDADGQLAADDLRADGESPPGPAHVHLAPALVGRRADVLVRITATDGAGNRRTYGADNAQTGRRLTSAVVRVLGVDAGFTGESYVGSSSARLAIETDATALTLQTFRAGPEETRTHSDTLMNGVAVNAPVTIPWSARHRRATLNFAIGPWATGVYFVKLTANDGRIGYAPFVVRPTTLGENSRVAVVMPTNTWQAYNFRDADGNGWGDTWYAKGAQSTAALGRMYIRRGVPPQWRKYDVDFLRWLHMTGKQPDILTETDLESIRTAEELIALYDFVVFPGHTEYVTRHEYDLIRNSGTSAATSRSSLRTTSSGRCGSRAGPCGGHGSGVTSAGPSPPSSASSTAATTTAGSRSRSSCARPRRRRGSTRGPGSPTARRSARSSAATGSRSTRRRRRRRRGRSCSRRSPISSDPA